MLVELLLRVALDVHAAVRPLRPVARGHPTLLGLRVRRALLVLGLPVVADLLERVLDGRPRGLVRAGLAVVGLLGRVERLRVRALGLRGGALERAGQVFLLRGHTTVLPADTHGIRAIPPVDGERPGTSRGRPGLSSTPPFRGRYRIQRGASAAVGEFAAALSSRARWPPPPPRRPRRPGPPAARGAPRCCAACRQWRRSWASPRCSSWSTTASSTTTRATRSCGGATSCAGSSRTTRPTSRRRRSRPSCRSSRRRSRPAPTRC